jgi:hypothetical protein
MCVHMHRPVCTDSFTWDNFPKVVDNSDFMLKHDLNEIWDSVLQKLYILCLLYIHVKRLVPSVAL